MRGKPAAHLRISLLQHPYFPVHLVLFAFGQSCRSILIASGQSTAQASHALQIAFLGPLGLLS